MSAQPAYSHLRAERGGQAPAVALPPARMTPAEIPLTLSADVLRLPLGLATRLVLAEIVSLYAATQLCDASDSHFAARLTVSTDTASRAVKELEAEGLLVKVTARVGNVLYRTLTPNPAAIAEKAAANPYPQNAGTYPQNAARGTRKMPEGYPQNAGRGTGKMRVGVPAKCGSNTPLNIPDSFQGTPADAGAPAEEKKELAEASLPPPDKPNASAAHTGGAAADVATAIAPAEQLPTEAEAQTARFEAFWLAYPRHDGKVKAGQSFARLSLDEQTQATALAPAFFARRADWISATGTDYRPHAATWLTQKRWQELAEPLPTPTTTPLAHATATPTTPANRPAGNGAKPTGGATELAGALARRRFQQPGGGAGHPG